MKTASKINMKRATTHDTIIITLTTVVIDFFSLELSVAETVDPGGLFGKCNLAFPGKKEELGNFLRISGTTPDRSFSEALKPLSPFGMLFGSGPVKRLSDISNESRELMSAIVVGREPTKLFPAMLSTLRLVNDPNLSGKKLLSWL
jgi:hypothetical protein